MNSIVSTREVSEQFEVNPQQITKVIKKHKSDFENFGELIFESMPTTGNQVETVYFLNEMQFTLLILHLINNSKVAEYKKNFVKAFFSIKNCS